MKFRDKLTLMTTGAALVVGLGGAVPAFAEDVTLTMAVPDWPPTRIMKDLFDKNYKAPSGNTVKLDIDFIPWPDYYTRLNTSLTSGENKYNMAVSDSQWLGAFIEAGYYRKINDLIDADPGPQGDSRRACIRPCCRPTRPIRTSRRTTTASRRCRTSCINYYRTDVFCNEEEQKNFQAKYNEKLPCTPEEMDDVDWDMFEKFGEFFMRKKGEMLAGKLARRRLLRDRLSGRQGLRLLDDADQRLHLAAWRQHLGRDQGAQGPRRRRRELAGGGQGARSLSAADQVHAARSSRPAAWTSSRPTSCSAKARSRSNIEWIGFAESSINPETSKVADKVAFAHAPGLSGPDGKLIRWAQHRRSALRAS